MKDNNFEVANDSVTSLPIIFTIRGCCEWEKFDLQTFSIRYSCSFIRIQRSRMVEWIHNFSWNYPILRMTKNYIFCSSLKIWKWFREMAFRVLIVGVPFLLCRIAPLSSPEWRTIYWLNNFCPNMPKNLSTWFEHALMHKMKERTN